MGDGGGNYICQAERLGAQPRQPGCQGARPVRHQGSWAGTEAQRGAESTVQGRCQIRLLPCPAGLIPALLSSHDFHTSLSFFHSDALKMFPDFSLVAPFAFASPRSLHFCFPILQVSAQVLLVPKTLSVSPTFVALHSAVLPPSLFLFSTAPTAV